jgi:hypothetical protein
MNAWSKANRIKNDDIYFMTDDGASFSKSMGWAVGDRAARYALAVDKGTVIYAAKEQPGKLDVSVVLSHHDEYCANGGVSPSGFHCRCSSCKTVTCQVVTPNSVGFDWCRGFLLSPFVLE